jgi:hypothetical protein
LRQLKTWLAFTPWARAMTATDGAPGRIVSSTTCRRSSFERIRRLPPGAEFAAGLPF